MKYIKLSLFFILLFCIYNVNACNVTGKISQCNSAVGKYILKVDGKDTYIIPGASIKEVDDFICLQDTRESRLFQIVIDDKFKKIDEEMDTYLFNLQKAKGLFFSKGTGNSHIDGVNSIWAKSDYFEEKYKLICREELLPEINSCMETDEYTSGSILKVTQGVSVYNYKKQTELCSELVDVKINIFRDISFNTLMINKQKVIDDNKKKYNISQREKYDNLIDTMMINFGYIERIWQKWPNKIKKAL